MAEADNNNNHVMTPAAQRRASCEEYIDSPTFGRDTWVTITAFKENVNNVIVTMQLYRDLLSYLDQGFLPAQFPQQQQMLRIKQHIVLDLILKAQIIVESSLVFIHELSTNGYRGLSRTMARYTLNHVNTVVLRAIGENDIPYLLRGMGVPHIANMLSLEQHEIALLQDLYRQTGNNGWNALRRLASFYDSFKTVYNKYRHGLILRTGGTHNNRGFALERSFVEALDFKDEDDLPRDVIIIDRNVNNNNNRLPGMFNALSHVIVGQRLIDEIFEIVSVAQEIVNYTCDNHKLYAINCGLSYLPFVIVGGQPQGLAFMVSPEAYRGNEQVLTSVANKIRLEMNIVQNELTGEQFAFDDERVIRAIQNNNIVTNIFIRNAPQGTNP